MFARNALLVGSSGGSSVAEIALEVKDSLTSTTEATSYTISGADLGTAGPNRWIAVAWAARRSGGVDPGLNTATVNGTAVDYFTSTHNGNSHSGAVFVKLSTSSSGDVVLTFDLSVIGIAMQVFVFQSDATDPRHEIDTATTASTTVDIVSGGGAIAALMGNNGGGSGPSWTGLTERNQVDLNTNEWATTAGDNLSSETGRTISVADAGSAIAMSVISLKPS